MFTLVAFDAMAICLDTEIYFKNLNDWLILFLGKYFNINKL